jgi:hypothetical protein
MSTLESHPHRQPKQVHLRTYARIQILHNRFSSFRLRLAV